MSVVSETIDRIKSFFHHSKEVFDHHKVLVVFVLGGPGAGKGTQCARLVQEFGFCHLSAGDLLRAEQHREGSEFGDLIRQYIREGKIVPSEVTVNLLKNAMKAELEKHEEETENGWGNGKGRFLVDGFPRKMDQAHIFDETVCESKFVLFFVTTEDVLLQRLLERGKTSGREDDNEESIKKRFRTFVETSMPVVEYYREHDKVVEIDATKSIDEVYERTSNAVKAHLSI
ncbi:UMP-CMP kinase [Serendipita sp. 398]|nr:UMP-CMP kinase [Serendipita sp. 398]